MREVRIAPSFNAWRDAARRLLGAEVPPASVLWRETTDAQPMFDGLVPAGSALPVAPITGTEPAAARVPRAFVAAAVSAACFRDPARWALLYRVLWRLTHGEPRLMDVVVDADVHRLLGMERAVRRDVHKLHAFVRFRRVEQADGTGHFVAWFEPQHLTVELATPFFARRFASMRWSVLTPDRTARWDGSELHFGPGVPRAEAPAGDELESLWRTYYAHTFNPARLKLDAMRSEMPRHFWANLPEAGLIPDLVHEAPRRVAAMLERARADEARRQAALNEE